MRFLFRSIKFLFWTFIFLFILYTLLAIKKNPEKINYGVSFSKLYTDELGLPFESTYLSILDELKVKKLRLVAYWPLIEKEKGIYDFKDLDFEIKEAEKREAEVILAVGRRVPRWPECHVPNWAKGESWEDQKKEILVYLEKTVNHYKNYSNIKYWQVENEPYLTVFATENCGKLDEEFLKEEIALVKKLDNTRPILVTDSGNLGLWYGAWKRGDAFGTSVYIYLWNQTVGEVKTFYKPSFYKFKTNLMTAFFGPKKSFLIELSLEPWLIEPIQNASLELQISRMDINKFNEVFNYAKNTGFEEQYLWGVEWWYYMKTKNHPEYWNRAKEIFKISDDDQ